MLQDEWLGGLRGLKVFGLMLGLVAAGLADARVAQADEPAPRVVRLQYLKGEVTVARPDNTGGDPAQLNMPLPEGSRVTTGQNGEAEIEFEDGSVVRLTPQTTVALVHLRGSDGGAYSTEVSLAAGLMYAELRATATFGFRIDAGEQVVTPRTNTTVRIAMDKPPATVAAFDGSVHVEGGFRTDVRKGESLRPDAQDAERYFLTPEIAHETWDDWNEARDQSAADALAAQTSARDQFAGQQGYGWSDLDASGTWYDVPGQGRVWQPFEASTSGFDPFGNGSWVWYSGPGYVWTSGYRWGWTPYRCGSWSYWKDFGWGWVPGRWSSGEWRYGSGNKVVNLTYIPPGYHRPQPPAVAGAQSGHPTVPVRSAIEIANVGRPGERSARTLAGHAATPLRPVGLPYTQRGGSAMGSSLMRDFPVDRATRRPVLGSATVPVGVPGMGVRGPGAIEGRGQAERAGSGAAERTPAGPMVRQGRGDVGTGRGAARRGEGSGGELPETVYGSPNGTTFETPANGPVTVYGTPLNQPATRNNGLPQHGPVRTRGPETTYGTNGLGSVPGAGGDGAGANGTGTANGPGMTESRPRPVRGQLPPMHSVPSPPPVNAPAMRSEPSPPPQRATPLPAQNARPSASAPPPGAARPMQGTPK